ncbi:MAG: Gfo/Idh/MocA family oxidoreductase [Myxococcales bacterium]|nr:Gfo/Idh/MocA family oxidoreductase [Myxococcales bacterium]
MDKVRVGMIGAGRITDLHYPAYRDYPKAELVTVCAATPETARKRQAEWGARKWATDYREVLADPEIDMVEINTPHHLHHPMVLAAAAAGKHIQLQKPMGMNIRECDEMIAATRKAGVKFKVIENFVFYPPYRKAKELIDAGEIGPVQSIRIRLGSGGTGGWYVPLNTWLWRLAETDKGGGPSIFDDGYHKFSIGLFYGGPVEKVFAWIDRSFALIDAPAIVSWRAANGVVGCIDATFSPNLNVKSKYYSADERVEITGTRGVIWITRCTGRLLEEASVILYRDGVKTCFENLRTDWLESFIDSTRHFIDCIIDDTEPYLTGEQAKAVQQFCFAAIRSAKEGRELSPTEVNE